MNVHNPAPDWRKTKHEQKIELIIQAYIAGSTNSVSIAEWLSAYFTYPLTGDHVRELYSRNKVKGGKLTAYPLQPVPHPKKVLIDMDLASHLWNDGVPGCDIAARFGITRDQLYEIVEKRRDLFPRRAGHSTNIIPSNHPERVTRYVNGWPITLPRVTFIDGKSSQ